MTKQSSLWQFILQHLAQEMPIMLMYVLDSKGSSPGRKGFAMAVTASGKTHGSIGGGIMEHKFAEMAIANLQALPIKPLRPTVRKQVHDKTAAQNQSGMICSGEQTIFLYPVQQEDKNEVEKIIEHLQERKLGWLQLDNSGFKLLTQNKYATTGIITETAENWHYIEKIGYKNHLQIIGGGHCALALSKLLYSMDFHVCIYEDRENLDTLQQNDYAHEIKILEDYSQLSTQVETGPDLYVAIMTVGYRTDYLALKTIIDKPFKYLGVLGSKKKMEKLLLQLEEDGVDKATLTKIHTPIGLPINSQTPEEIAISIAAEIILIKNSI